MDRSPAVPDGSEARHASGWLRGRLTRVRPAPAPGTATVMRRVAVVTDSAAGLPPSWVARHDDGRLAVVPMPVILGDDVYGEGDSDLQRSLAMALAAGTGVRTSRPSPGQFERAYAAAAAAGFDSVLCLPISARLSGTLEAARLAVRRAPLTVEVMDSANVGMAQGFAVQAAVAASEAGGDLGQVRQVAAAVLAGARTYFYVPSLDQLRRGGRIGAASSWLGTVLAIKPILAIRDGAVVPLEKVRTAGKALARLEQLAREDIAARDGRPVAVAIHHFGNLGQAQDIGDRLRAECPAIESLTMTALPAVLAAHAGLGVVAVIIADAAGGPGREEFGAVRPPEEAGTVPGGGEPSGGPGQEPGRP